MVSACISQRALSNIRMSGPSTKHLHNNCRRLMSKLKGGEPSSHAEANWSNANGQPDTLRWSDAVVITIT
ncbi:hypothetical protein GWI33_007753 [Rhynchophorus ferrugineus]|uniref:Uncharacterized protein n=1 Tax=Rhynchophorus ferrugineus TaxID=354439 RepID=A0A834IY15_RHYFE|nr:hypothetical protein GWI33_007753 [Rhynchophorus ferrugineus]